MKLICSLLTVAMMLLHAGCAKPIPVGHISVLQPDRDMQLAFRTERRLSVGAFTLAQERTWCNIIVNLSTQSIPFSDCLKIAMRYQEVKEGHQSTYDGKEEVTTFNTNNPVDSKSEDENILHNAIFIAIINSDGIPTSFGASGNKYWTDLKKEWTKAGLTKLECNIGYIRNTPGIFPALQDALAYLPTPEIKPGQAWKVHRKEVFPCRAYEFYMLTNGCSYYEEETKCTLKAIVTRDSQRIAKISIKGRRIPHDPEEELPKRVEYFELCGELEVNMDTAAVEKLKLKSTAVTTGIAKEKAVNLQFTEEIKLTPK